MDSELWDYHGAKHKGLQVAECKGDKRLVFYVPLEIKKISMSYVNKTKSWSRNAWLHRFPGQWRQSPGKKQLVVMLVNQCCIYTCFWFNYVSIYIFICRFGPHFFRHSCIGSLHCVHTRSYWPVYFRSKDHGIALLSRYFHYPPRPR